jgi:Flp pilus assembly protein TadB
MAHHAGVFVGGEPKPVREVLADMVHDVQDLFRSEARLARAEITDQVGLAKTTGAAFGAAAVTGLFAGFCLIATCIAALALMMPVWAAALIMAFVLGCAAVILYAGAKHKMHQIHAKPEQTVETLREDVQWLKQRTK